MSDDFVNPYESDNLAMIEEALEENVRLGFMEHAGVGEDGDIRYRMTPAGKAKIDAIIADLKLDPEVAAMYREGLGGV